MSTMKTEPIGAKDLAIGIHVLMKDADNWTRFQSHKMSEDRKSITVELADGREFTVAVYPSEKPYDATLFQMLVAFLTDALADGTPLPSIHDALVAYVDYWRNS